MAKSDAKYNYAEKNLHAALTATLDGDHVMASIVQWYYSEGVRAHSEDGYYYRQIDLEGSDTAFVSRSKQMTRLPKMEKMGLLEKGKKRKGQPLYPLKAGRLTYNLPRERDEDGNLIPLPEDAPRKARATRGGKYNVSYLNINFKCDRLKDVVDPVTKKTLHETFQERRYESINWQLRKEAARQAKLNKLDSERKRFKQLHEGLHARICSVCWFDNKPIKADAVKTQHKQVWGFLYRMNKQGLIALVVQEIDVLWDIKHKRGQMGKVGLYWFEKRIKEGKSMEKCYEEWLENGKQKGNESLAQVQEYGMKRQKQIEQHEFARFQSLLASKLKVGFDQKQYIDAIRLGGIDHNSKKVELLFASDNHWQFFGNMSGSGEIFPTAAEEVWGKGYTFSFSVKPPT